MVVPCAWRSGRPFYEQLRSPVIVTRGIPATPLRDGAAESAGPGPLDVPSTEGKNVGRGSKMWKQGFRR